MAAEKPWYTLTLRGAPTRGHEGLGSYETTVVLGEPWMATRPRLGPWRSLESALRAAERFLAGTTRPPRTLEVMHWARAMKRVYYVEVHERTRGWPPKRAGAPIDFRTRIGARRVWPRRLVRVCVLDEKGRFVVGVCQ